MNNPIPFVRVYFNDGRYMTVGLNTVGLNHEEPLTREEADVLSTIYSLAFDKPVVTVERTDSIDTEYETYGYNSDGELVTEYRREDTP